MTAEPPYSAIRRLRAETAQRFSDYPLIVDRDGWIVRRVVSEAKRVLEIGCGDTPFEPALRHGGFTGVFKTMDADRSVACDYYAIEDVSEDFDAVIMREVIEHLPRSVFYSYLSRIHELLSDDGVLVLTTPNPWAPGWVFSDYTHCSAWPPADLYGILRWYGFTAIEIHRIIWPSRFLWLKRMYWSIHSRLYDVDFAGSYLAFARKSAISTVGRIAKDART